MEVWIKIACENSAFEDDPSAEVARILRELAERLDGHPHFSPGHDQALADVDGHEVGFCGVYGQGRMLAPDTDETAAALAAAWD